MPIGYLDVPPGLDVSAKRELVKGIYDALSEAYPFPDDHRIFLREWPLDSVSQDGLLGPEPMRPVFQIHAPQGLDVEAKRKMMRDLDAAVADAYHLPEFQIFIHEHPLSLVGNSGSLLADDQQRVEDQGNVYDT